MGIDEGRRRRAGRMAAVACACLLLVPLAGCAADPKPAAPSSTPTATPVFASDEEALAAATEAYKNYLRVHDEFWTVDGSSRDEFLALSTGTVREDDQKSIEEWNAKGWRGVGSTSFDSMEFQGMDVVDGVQRITTYLCLDVSKGDVVDATGASVALSDRPLRFPLEVEFQADAKAPTDLKVARSEVWQGENFC